MEYRKNSGRHCAVSPYNYTKLAEEGNDPKVLSEGYSYVAENYPWMASGFWWELNNMNALCDTNPIVRAVSI